MKVLNKKKDEAISLALRLALSTDHRSTRGLLLIVCGMTLSDEHRVAIFKLPSDDSIEAIPSDSGLIVRQIEWAFSSKTEYFKAAVFQGNSSQTSFWSGQVEDRQATSRSLEVSGLWVNDFLQAQPETTDARGTRFLIQNIKKLLEAKTDDDSRHQIISAVQTIRSQSSRYITLTEFARNYLNPELAEIYLGLPDVDTLKDEIFKLDFNTLDQLSGTRSIILDSDFVITGPVENFNDTDKLIETTQNGSHIFIIKGKIVGERLKSLRRTRENVERNDN